MRKTLALTLTLMMLLSTVCFAAVSSSGSRSSGSRSSSSKPSSSSSQPIKQAAPDNGSYKPSAPANSYGDKAPTKQATPGVQQNTQPQSSSSSFWRNASMIGGGFLAGSLLGNMFGFGNMGEGMSSIFGMLINIMMLAGLFMAIRYFWSKYKNKDKDKDIDNRYR